MASFGERLRKTRENKKITLDDVAKATKISTRMLRALEEEKFDQLPGGVFNKGFVRAYARHLGLDEDKTLADYVAAAGGEPEPKPEDAELRAIAERKEREQQQINRSAGLPWGVLALLLLVLALGLAVWGFYSRQQVRSVRVQRMPVANPPAEPLPSSPVPAVVQQPSPTEAPSSPAQTIPAAAPVATSYNPAASPTPASGPFVVLIIAHEDSWVSIAADGSTIYEGTLAAPGEKSVAASQQVVLRAGNIGGLAIFFNGKKLPPQGEEGQTKKLTFGANGLEPEPPKPPTP